MGHDEHYGVLIIGAGLAGLSLARQILLTSDQRILLVDKQAEIPRQRQKVGEATVQVSGYYLSKVLDLEEHLLREHFMKYNLRFYWNTPGRSGDSYEDYSQSYIRNLSNVATYQVDRNKLERELLRLNEEYPAFTFQRHVTELNISMDGNGPHKFCFQQCGTTLTGTATWVVDSSGRSKFLTRNMDLGRANQIHHGASWVWVDGLVNIEKLTSLSRSEIRLRKDRSSLGHLPVFLATNHFVGEGFWFWVIPLHGKTSLGLVFDSAMISPDAVNTPEKLIRWICDHFPLFARDLPQRALGDHGFFREFSYDCAQTISLNRWGVTGEAGRFTDPLYSPGGDLISIYNTLITDAILTSDSRELALKTKLYEQLMRACYGAYVPSYSVSYDCLGDQEVFSIKYTWELTIYFAFYVFPFINDLFTDTCFLRGFLQRFLLLKPMNSGLQNFLSSYFQWKKTHPRSGSAPVFHDFTALGPLQGAERTFYKVGLSVPEALRVLDEQLESATDLYRYAVAYITSKVLDDREILFNHAFITAIPLEGLRFDPVEMARIHAGFSGPFEPYRWCFDSLALEHFRMDMRTDVCHV
jgi:flavin-dependent dehydrogenase